MTDKTLIDEREWEAQERGMRAARGRDAGSLDVVALNYRQVAEALISAPLGEPPDSFAAAVVKHAARHDAGIERLLSRILLAVFLVATIMLGVLFGEQWWQSLHQTLGDDAQGWVLTGIGCVTLSWLFSRVLELASHAGEPRRA